MNRHVVRDTVVLVTLCLGSLAGLSAVAVALRSIQLSRFVADARLAMVWAAGLAGVGLLWRYRSAGSDD